MSCTIEFMEEEWKRFFYRNKCKGDPLPFFQKVKEQYEDSLREYHTLEGHISQCLSELREVSFLCDDPDFVYYELLNHDVYYDIEKEDNEEKSASFAYELGREMYLPKMFLEKNGEVILSTKHEGSPNSEDAKVGEDIDLSILGKDPDEFEEYEIKIRKEYYSVPNNIYREKRISVLKDFLNRDIIFNTQFFRERYESQARENLRKSIKRLK